MVMSYRFGMRIGAAEDLILSRRRGTRAGIAWETGDMGVVIESSGVEVDKTCLTSDMLYLSEQGFDPYQKKSIGRSR